MYEKCTNGLRSKVGVFRPDKRGKAFKNPHIVADDHGDPDTLLANLNAAETETAMLRDQLKTILAEALAR